MEFVQKLSSHMNQLNFQELAEGIHHKPSKFPLTKIPKLQVGDFVWVRIDRVRRPLEAPYQGPYKILELIINLSK